MPHSASKARVQTLRPTEVQMRQVVGRQVVRNLRQTLVRSRTQVVRHVRSGGRRSKLSVSCEAQEVEMREVGRSELEASCDRTDFLRNQGAPPRILQTSKETEKSGNLDVEFRVNAIYYTRVVEKREGGKQETNSLTSFRYRTWPSSRPQPSDHQRP